MKLAAVRRVRDRLVLLPVHSAFAWDAGDLPAHRSLALRSLGDALERLDPAPRSAYAPLHVDIAQELGCIRVPNLWTRRGSYQPSIEDLRSHPEVESFRTFLSQQPLEEGAEAAERAATITRLADEYARKALRGQAKKRSLRQTIGRAGSRYSIW